MDWLATVAEEWAVLVLFQEITFMVGTITLVGADKALRYR
jgi:hypothetical protein